MNSRVQEKINEIKKLSMESAERSVSSHRSDNQQADGLSIAIRTKKDADIFMAELKAITKKSN